MFVSRLPLFGRFEPFLRQSYPALRASTYAYTVMCIIATGDPMLFDRGSDARSDCTTLEAVKIGRGGGCTTIEKFGDPAEIDC